MSDSVHWGYMLSQRAVFSSAQAKPSKLESNTHTHSHTHTHAHAHAHTHTLSLSLTHSHTPSLCLSVSLSQPASFLRATTLFVRSRFNCSQYGCCTAKYGERLETSSSLPCGVEVMFPGTFACNAVSVGRRANRGASSPHQQASILPSPLTFAVCTAPLDVADGVIINPREQHAHIALCDESLSIPTAQRGRERGRNAIDASLPHSLFCCAAL